MISFRYNFSVFKGFWGIFGTSAVDRTPKSPCFSCIFTQDLHAGMQKSPVVPRVLTGFSFLPFSCKRAEILSKTAQNRQKRKNSGTTDFTAVFRTNPVKTRDSPQKQRRTNRPKPTSICHKTAKENKTRKSSLLWSIRVRGCQSTQGFLAKFGSTFQIFSCLFSCIFPGKARNPVFTARWPIEYEVNKHTRRVVRVVEGAALEML